MEELKNIHPLSDVKSNLIGDNTRIWQFVVILPNAKIGNDVNICSHCFIENDVIIGDRVTIKSGVQIWDGIRIGDDVFIGPNVTFSNDKFPRSKKYPEKFLETQIENGASIGGGAVILPGISIGTGAMVGAGAIVTKSVPPYAIVSGCPARIVGYVGTNSNTIGIDIINTSMFTSEEGFVSIGVGEVTLHRFKVIRDMRGDLSVGDFEKSIPFEPKRYFMVFNVPSEKTRGEHAHYKCHQFLICIKGSCSVVVDDGKNRAEIKLDSLDKGIYLPPLIWGIQYKYSKDAVLLVFASDHYDPEDYIRNYNEFLDIVSNMNTQNVFD
ncbi:TPA: WxcM-like domain-containing protein [Legionella pneumophila]|uniref:WxcM-like domain-containing protein n=1 Tax=Legionella pneumophila TaxID=446 RepID=UPI0029902805|nr:WxcM-like domain-containing protein [Legionella pneumophila]MDW8993551.1 WxcM-like domain-containing protein [Legionella pneumophila]MDW9000007.1 WxcM-like domain-containing protein [Legionella pneumophila]MDW9002997.1 WxcM-like domain-containing protein [Legionella pneumophila]